ncbi:MAG TPA: DNA repair protein RecO C-terminal domain-containing protein [Candidatus Avidesulfovibrio excrementigallinarum]|nr:DNA repair protein RecO C-terminal domain-containing protein [Candidatus Avidesulfovibrio excrementigallinarum]
MEWTDTALVLSLGRFREIDVWLRLLTHRHGIVHVFAFGGSRSRKRFPGCLDMLNLLRIRVDTGRTGQFPTLCEASLVWGPRSLRTGGSRLGMAMNCLRFLEALGLPQDDAGEALTLTQSLLTLLEGDAAVPETLPILFRLRLASGQGYVPSFARCSACGAPLGFNEGDTAGEDAFWSVPEGAVRCPRCAAGKGQRSQGRLTPAMLRALATVQDAPPECWGHDGLTAHERQDCARYIDEFVQYHLGLVWDRGRFGKV